MRHILEKKPSMRVFQGLWGTREQRKKSEGTREREPILGNGGTRTTGKELRGGVGGKQICKREQISRNCGNKGRRPPSPPPGDPQVYFKRPLV